MIDIHDLFERHNDEYLKFDRVDERMSDRPDLCAFLLLDSILPGSSRDIVCAAEHDVIYLDTDCEELAKVATEDKIITLARCGVLHDRETDSLFMFA